MPKPKRRPKNTAVEQAGAQKVVSMPAGGWSARTERDLTDRLVGIQAPDTTSAGAKGRKARRVETKSSDRFPPPPPQEPQVAPQSPPPFASRQTPRAKRGSSAATIAIVACCGGIVGSLATIGATKYWPVAFVPSAIANGDLVHRLAHIDSELASLKASIAPSAEKEAERGEGQSASLPEQGAIGANDATGPMPDAPSGPVSTASPGTESVIDGWVLRNVSGGSALVEGRPGLIQVMPGDSLPGVGRVETIKREDGRWVVVTTGGLIASR
ncbi:MAG: hypothetical protein J2P54_14635 [Bradyrhizobiaceae bacterium]|nr:hypothetical protein [Bradyrhizobiaceae bacterium]